MRTGSRACEPLMGGLALITVAVASWFLKHFLAPAVLDHSHPRSLSSADWYLWVMLAIGFFHVLEGLAGFRLFRLRHWARVLGAWHIRRHPYPDAMAHPSTSDPAWARPTLCRCGQARPATLARCPTCGRI